MHVPSSCEHRVTIRACFLEVVEHHWTKKIGGSGSFLLPHVEQHLEKYSGFLISSQLYMFIVSWDLLSCNISLHFSPLIWLSVTFQKRTLTSPVFSVLRRECGRRKLLNLLVIQSRTSMVRLNPDRVLHTVLLKICLLKGCFVVSAYRGRRG